MVDTNHPDHPEGRPEPGGEALVPAEAQVPVEEEAAEMEAPRRAASAQFIVQSDVGSDVAMREAMDPANQSLAEALRLSYRVLQIVMVILILLFFASSFETVDENQSGVFTRFGRIVPIDDQMALEPGAKWTWWPYPVGEFVLFDVQNRQTSVGDAFWPGIRPGQDLQQMISSASSSDILRPGRDGSLITAEGNFAHLRVVAKYEIVDPVAFVEHVRVDGEQSNQIVSVALQRATTYTAMRTPLDMLVDDQRDIVTNAIREDAQAMLDELNVGIRIASVSIPDATPPLAIRKNLADIDSAREDMGTRLNSARQEAQRVLYQTAGTSYSDLVDLIDQYQDALDQEEEAEADRLLAEINALLDGEDVGGDVAAVIARAEAYQAEIERTLGREARRFASYLEQFRQSPRLLVQQLRLEARGEVLGRRDAEVVRVPDLLGRFRLSVTGSSDVQEMRRKAELDRRARESATGDLTGLEDAHIRRAGDMVLEGPGRRLEVVDGEVKGAGAD